MSFLLHFSIINIQDVTALGYFHLDLLGRCFPWVWRFENVLEFFQGLACGFDEEAMIVRLT